MTYCRLLEGRGRGERKGGGGGEERKGVVY